MAKKEIKTPILKLSMTSIDRYMQCPKLWYFCYKEKLPDRTDYPRLCGVIAHRFIAGLYKKHPDDRPFWYKSIDTARKAWFVIWENALNDNRSKILIPDAEMEKKYAGIGCICIQNYWDDNVDSVNKPIMIEKSFHIDNLYYPDLRNVSFVGKFDLVVNANPEWLIRRRPEIFEGDKILPTHAPRIIVDLKTGWLDYSISDDDSDLVKVRKQISAQLGIQGASYSLLYKYNFGKYPAGFLLYPLRFNKNSSIFIKGDEKGSQEVLRENVFHVVENIRNGSFPRHVTSACNRCDYVMECRPDGTLFVSLPEAMPEEISEPKDDKKEDPVQLKLNFKRNPKK